ncbi:GNAT family N-acetyltransferase [Tahibacter amnicola]|uniref:GNAT family N-acetyltransferase n=1 Tax=Tahibacter amnicola TaxID=2976241 RepID=A0ABY6BPA1_9GAMM|nr:GNAT family protein [Tahibacter amnicola]UXI69597.1 GNAT family N-acetyltransferase [Tahibacter amnicola]
MKTSASLVAMSNYRSRVRPPERLRFRAANDAPRSDGEWVKCRDGRSLRLRPIHPDDVVALQRGFSHLSAEEIRMRFLHALTELPDALATRLCQIDPDREIALVLVDGPEVPEPEIHGVARAYIDPTTDSAEFAVIVQKALNGQGFGRLLMQRVIAACRARGVREIWGDVLVENGRMLTLCDSLGFRREPVFHGTGLTRVRLAI